MTTSAGKLRTWVKSSALLKPVLKRIYRFRCASWDLIHGVDTCGEIPLSELAFSSENKSPGLEYQSHHPSVTRAALNSLGVRYEDYTFIDIGCGKGRVLLIAAELPFRKVIGLEFAPSLAEVARRNVQRYRGGASRRAEIEVVTGDATRYDLPHEPQVLYFFSPFSPDVLNQVIQRVEDSFLQSPRNLLVMFTGVPAMRDRAFGSRPQYERLSRAPHMDLYRRR